MDAKIDTLWARYSQNDQTDCFHFLKLSFFYRINDAYSFWAQSGISKGMFILVLHTGEKPSKCYPCDKFHSFCINFASVKYHENVKNTRYSFINY